MGESVLINYSGKVSITREKTKGRKHSGQLTIKKGATSLRTDANVKLGLRRRQRLLLFLSPVHDHTG